MQLKRHFRAGRRPREAVMTFLEESHRLGVGGDQEGLLSSSWKQSGLGGDARRKWDRSSAVPVPSRGWDTLRCLLGCSLQSCLDLQFPNWNLGSPVGSKERL